MPVAGWPTRHRLTVGGSILEHTATAGRAVLREEVHEDGRSAGHRAKAEMSLVPSVVDGPADGGSTRRPAT